VSAPTRDAALRGEDAGIHIRRLGLGDLPAVEAIERRAYRTPWSRTMFSGEISRPGSRCYGALIGRTLIGYLIVSRYTDAWHIMNIAVDEPQRGRGIARMLLGILFDEVDETGRGFTLEVRVSNVHAIRLYESLGFRPSGIRRGYYTDDREDALIMWRGEEPRGPLVR
jgi:ribosomal-protein-alanine N-acetyltransferase